MEPRLRRIPVYVSTVFDHFEPQILMYSDYYPFGAKMPGRNSNVGDYRYGFNGQEKDDEMKGEANSYDFGARIYDNRLGRFFSVDPKFKLYTDMSPYNFAVNNPIYFIDYMGEGPETPTLKIAVKNSPEITKADEAQMLRLIREAKNILQQKNPSPNTPNLLKFLKIHPLISAIVILATSSDQSGIINRQYAKYQERQAAYKKSSDWQCQTCIESEIRSSMYMLMIQNITIVNSDGDIEIFTNDPSTLGDSYLAGVRHRIESGQARPTDWRYADEAYRREGSDFKTHDQDNLMKQKTIVTFTQGRDEKRREVSVVLPEGYKIVKNVYSNGQKVYSNGIDFISPDKDGHNGGIWKKASTIKNLGKKETRDGTYDENLNCIGE